jgi:tetratricopeptide (TPR) repeat protein
VKFRFLFLPVFFTILSAAAWSRAADKNESACLPGSEPADTCLCRLLEGVSSSDSVMTFLKRWSEKKHLSNAALVNCYKSKLRSHARHWQEIIRIWEKSNGTPYEVFVALVNSGRQEEADRIFTVFESEGKLDSHDLLRWAKVKSVIGDFKRIPGLVCRFIDAEPRLTSVALNQFNGFLDEMSPSAADSAIKGFLSCGLAKPGSDSATIISWTADACSRLGFYDLEIEILSLSRLPSIQEKLLDAAKNRFSRRKYREAIKAAKKFYEIKPNKEAATIIYRSFRETGADDSAITWIERTGYRTDNSITEAVILYQNAGQFNKASALIDSLPRSLGRDTLILRQYLFTGEREKAADAVKSSTFLNKSEKLTVLWKIRTLLFSRRMDEFLEYLKKVKIVPSWDNAGELLSYKYRMQRLAKSTVALDTWAEIEYNIYIGKPQQATGVLAEAKVSDDLKGHLILHLAGALIDRGENRAALSLLSTWKESKPTPEFLYCKGEALFRTGETDSAMGIMKRIVMEFPGDIFSGKARIFLSEINSKM